VGIGAAVAGASAIGSVASGIIGAGAAKDAAQTQADAAAKAQAAQLAQQQQTRSDLAPFRTAGTDALAQLRAALGLPAMADSTGATPGSPLTANGLSGLTFQPTQASLEQTPGYQFALAQGERGVENSASAQGRGISGAAMKGAAQFATGLASQTLGQQQQIFQQNLGNVLNPITSLVGSGQNAANQTGTLGAQNTLSANQFGVGGANALAAGQVGSANAIGGGLTGVGNAGQNFLLFNALNNQGGLSAGQNSTIAANTAAAFQGNTIPQAPVN
jgi:hypothetical protein